MNLSEGRTPKFYARDGSMLALATSVRERRRQRRLAYTFDPGLALAEKIVARVDTDGSNAPSTECESNNDDIPGDPQRTDRTVGAGRWL